MEQEQQKKNFIKSDVICRFSSLPNKGLLKSFDAVGLNEPIEMSSSDFYDKDIFEMQVQHIEARAKELKATLHVYQLPSASISHSDKYRVMFVNGI